MNKRELEEAIKDEVAEWPGVSVEFINATGGGHPKAKLKFGELVMSRPYSGTPSDSIHGLHKCLGDMRRVMKQLGAERSKPEPSAEDIEKRYRKRNEEGVKARPDPVKAEKAAVKPDVADQLVASGAATAEQAEIARASITADGPLRDGEGKPLLIGSPDPEREAERAALQAKVDAIEDGIYFGLAPEIYHAVPRLGSGSIRDLLCSPATFWRGSWLDPDRPELDEEQTKAQLLGKAYHTARLEPELFQQLFVREPSKDDYPAKGMLTSDQAVKAELKERGLTQTIGNETIEERCERLLDDGYQGTIWPLVKARWEKTVKGRTPIPGQFWDDIEVDMERLRSSPEIADKLVGGAAEVSIFWTDQYGVKCKARFDYLRPDLWDDFKTFANPRRKRIAQAIADSFRYDGYYLQAVHYRDAAEAVRIGGLQIKGEASDFERELIASIQMRPFELECWYIFQEKGRIPNLLARRFKFSDVPLSEVAQMAGLSEERRAAAMAAQGRHTGIHKLARAEIDFAKREFITYSQVYEPGEPWSPIEPCGTIDDNDFSPYWLEGRG